MDCSRRFSCGNSYIVVIHINFLYYLFFLYHPVPFNCFQCISLLL
jgi:hypothetical protein